jgi:hypothetical protein
VREVLVRRARIPHDAFSVHKYKPEDFLVMFDSAELRDRAAALPSLPHKHFTPFFRRWTRLAQAQKVSAGSLVHLAIEGIPPHTWDRSTVDHLLGTSCALDALALETADRSDPSLFKATAWTHDVAGIPTARLLWAPEPVDGVDPMGPQPVRRLRKLGLLEYKVLIHVTRVDEYAESEGPAWRRSSPGSDRSGLPSDDSLEEGFWTSRSTPWQSGCEDRRGEQGGGGSGHGYRDNHRQLASSPVTARSNWRLPALAGPVYRPVSDRIGTNMRPEVAGPSSAAPGQQAAESEIAFVAAGAPPKATLAVHDPNVAPAASEKGKEVGEVPDSLANKDRSDQLDPEAGAVGESLPILDTVGPVVELREVEKALDGMDSCSHATTTSQRGGQGLRPSPISDKRNEEYFTVSLSAGPGPIPMGRMDDMAPAQVSAQNSENMDDLQSVAHSLLESYAGHNVDLQLVQKIRVDEVGGVKMAEKALVRMKDFCSRLLKLLAPPLLREVESSLRAEAEPFTPRRSSKNSAMLKTPGKKASAAETALLRALGVSPTNLTADEDAISELKQLFDSPIRDHQLHVLAAIFGKTMPSRTEILNAGSVEISVSA